MSLLSKAKKLIKPFRPLLGALPVVGPIARAAEAVGQLHKRFVQPATRTIKTMGALVGGSMPTPMAIAQRLGTSIGQPGDISRINAQLAREASMLGLGRGFGFGAAGAAMGGGALVARGAIGWVLSATGRAIAWITASGARFSKRKAWDLAKRVGLETAALTLGMGAIELAQWLFGDPAAMPGRRRRRGISHGQLQTAKRVNRRVLAMVCDLQDMGKVKVTGVRRGVCK